MLTYSFENRDTKSLYQYLYKCIKNDILNGILPTDYKLPSKRAFAKHLNISTITVENAYYNLLSEGYIYSIPKKGYYVAKINNIFKNTDLDNNNNNNTNNTIINNNNNNTSNITHSINNENNIYSKDKKTYKANFNSNQTNPDNFPFSIWAKLLRNVINNQRAELMISSPYGGVKELREAISNHVYNYRGISVSPEQIIIGAGTEYLYGLLIQLLGRDKIYAVEDPGYKKISKIYSKNNVDVKYIPLTNKGISVNELYDSKADILHISPSHHFPTGIITPISTRYKLLEWANTASTRYIIEDDYDSEFRFNGKPIPSLQSIDSNEKVIYINTFSKSLASTIRISYMILPKHLLYKFQKELSFYSCTVSTFEQYTLAKFIKDGYFEKHINRMRIYYKNLRNSILNEIKNSPINSKVKITEMNSGLHFLMKVTNGLDDKAIQERADKLGINLAFMSEFYNTSNNEKHMYPTLVINYSGIKPDLIKSYINLLCKCIIKDK